MVYFHFPFSTHAPPFEEGEADVLELNLQELARRAAGSRGSTLVNSCAKNNLKIMIDIYPIISYL